MAQQDKNVLMDWTNRIQKLERDMNGMGGRVQRVEEVQTVLKSHVQDVIIKQEALNDLTNVLVEQSAKVSSNQDKLRKVIENHTAKEESERKADLEQMRKLEHIAKEGVYKASENSMAIKTMRKEATEQNQAMLTQMGDLPEKIAITVRGIGMGFSLLGMLMDSVNRNKARFVGGLAAVTAVGVAVAAAIATLKQF